MSLHDLLTQTPQPHQDGKGADDPGPRNVERDRQNPDVLRPPSTDHGTIPNLRFSFSDAHNRLEKGGWAREVTVRELPVAKTLAGVNMRLEPGAIREMHWHKEAEWAYMLVGSARITTVDQNGQNFADDVAVGDLWFFPSGIPHSIQALGDGCEFLLVFDDGEFSENSTFLITDWFAHTPKEVLAANFGVAASEFEKIPAKELYIFPGKVPGALATQQVESPQGPSPMQFSHRMLAQAPIRTPGGTVRVTDSQNFPVATTVAAALVELEPGAIREMHWHPTNDEWQYYIQGQARMTVFAAGGKARTFNYQAGDVGYVPFAMGHYIQNIGDTPVRFLELFRSARYADVSLKQWMALTPPELVQAHLHLGDAALAALVKEKKPVFRA
ncbi:oxalate decarboxylase family bicupin [Acidipila sp. EB88]|uniref:oxalate decarboxylase family bicupin n=1 Tax=Acidipila sp. EB88 TaxID=2305226 RepID=UPI000F5FE93D|nr:oxalate decarboxylase family bicupin [Acidipila sp. EB88]RRA48909.1 cupin domain-containing protein [Acidipila sp. EB88]